MVLWREDHESLHRRCDGTWQVARCRSQIASLPGVKMADACCGSRDVFAVAEVEESQELNKLVMGYDPEAGRVAGASTHIALD